MSSSSTAPWRRLFLVLGLGAIFALEPASIQAVPENGALLTPAQRERLAELGGQRPREAEPLTPAQAYGFLRGLAALQREEPAEARAELAPLVEEAGREDEWLLNAYGAALLEAGQPEEAAAILGAALDRYPRNGYLHLNLAWARLELDREVEAVPHLESFLASEVAVHDPQRRRRAYLALARAHQHSGRSDEREIVLQSALNDFPNDPWFAELLAETAFSRGDDETFRRLASQALRSYEASTGKGEFSWQAEGSYRLPLGGPVLIRRGFNADPGHRGLRMRFALDMWPLEEDSLRPRPEGVALQGSPTRRWSGFGREVLASRAGTVVHAVDRHPDREVTGLPEGLPYHPVNELVLRHDGGEVSIYRHLKQHSIRERGLAVGDDVARGDPVGAVGCNGTRTAFPRLTFLVARDFTEEGLFRGLGFDFAEVERFEAYEWRHYEAHTPEAGDTLRPAR